MNIWNGIGRLTKDVEITKSASGKSIGKTGIAITRPYKSPDGKRESDFFNLVAFGATADFMGKYFHKGSSIGVTGRLQLDKWTDKSGQNRQSVSIVVESADFTGSRDDTPVQHTQEQTPEQAPSTVNAPFMQIPDGIPEELPFS
jgi:single-strand DNA-binding protein